METLTGTAAGAHDFSLMNLFWQADTVVKAVMVLLMGGSRLLDDHPAQIRSHRSGAARSAAVRRRPSAPATASRRGQPECPALSSRRRSPPGGIGMRRRRAPKSGSVSNGSCATPSASSCAASKSGCRFSRRRLGGTVHRPVRHGVGHHQFLLRDRPESGHQPFGRRPWHRRGPVRDGDWPRRRHPGRDGLNKLSTDLSRLAQAYRTSIATVSDRLARDRSAVLRNAAE